MQICGPQGHIIFGKRPSPNDRHPFLVQNIVKLPTIPVSFKKDSSRTTSKRAADPIGQSGFVFGLRDLPLFEIRGRGAARFSLTIVCFSGRRLRLSDTIVIPIASGGRNGPFFIPVDKYWFAPSKYEGFDFRYAGPYRALFSLLLGQCAQFVWTRYGII